VDLLAVDTSTGSLVVIELKRGEGAPEVLDQIAKYVAWGRTNLAKDGQSIHGIICVGRRCSALEAAARQRGFEVYEYDFRLVRRT
jgi:RecB family endonuclease NucS